MASDYKFVSTDTEALVSSFVSAYEKLTSRTVNPADPDMLFIRWVADMFVQARVQINYAGNQNIPSRADGVNLDALGELFYTHTRPAATAATCTMEVTISAAQSSAVLIPAGTRFTDTDYTLYWDAVEDVYIAAGSTTATVTIVCETAGTGGNGYVAGQISTLVDISNIHYYESCVNTTVSDGGAEAATDAEFYALLRASEDAYSVAGPMGAYEYWAKQVSTEISDVKAIRPTERVTRTLPVFDGHAFIGGEHLFLSTLAIAGGTEGTDYTASYEDNLLTISITAGGALDGASTISATVTAEKAGHVYIYALMDDGTMATETIKGLIYDACNDEEVRPLTDYVEVRDPGTQNYNIDLTYYIQSGIGISASSIETAVSNAVAEYIDWQSARLGRDLNPSYLTWLLMQQEGIKRVVVRSPVFTELSDGANGSDPELAVLGTTTIVNGGYEDE